MLARTVHLNKGDDLGVFAMADAESISEAVVQNMSKVGGFDYTEHLCLSFIYTEGAASVTLQDCNVLSFLRYQIPTNKSTDVCGCFADSELSKPARGKEDIHPSVFAFLFLESLKKSSFLKFFYVRPCRDDKCHNRRENQRFNMWLLGAFLQLNEGRDILYYKDDSCWSVDLKLKTTEDIISIESFMEVRVLNQYVLVRKILILNQDFIAPPSEEELVTFIQELGYSVMCNMLSVIHTDQMHQPWRTFVAIINRCISGKTTGLDRLRKSLAQILWGMYNKKNVDYVALL
ncbi:hypothetical protein Tco_1022597 [Tanacetum coccineum]